MRYEIEYTAEAEEELDALDAYERGIILDAVEEGLRFEPTVRTKHRKPVEPVGVVVELEITWQLTVGEFRIFYDVTTGPENTPSALVVVIRIVRKGRQTTEGSLT